MDEAFVLATRRVISQSQSAAAFP